jgi:hypothetical protein
MLLPMPLRRPSAVGQWRRAYSHDTNHRFRTVSIAKIGGSKLFASRAPENEAVVIGARMEGSDESEDRCSLALLLGA